MIKIIAFDLVGVLVREKNIELSESEDKLERLFGPNLSDSDYIESASNIIDKDVVVDTAKSIINKLYEVKDESLFNNIKEINKDIKIIIATNHVSYIKEYINKYLDNNIDDSIISAEINRIKPNSDFYQYILDKYNIKPNELLFLDDNQNNVDGAKKLGINTIKVNRDTNILEEIKNYI